MQITCQQDITGANLAVAYAMTTDGAQLTKSPLSADDGTGTFRWGSLKDSDPFTGAVTGVVQANYCVAFQQTIP